MASSVSRHLLVHPLPLAEDTAGLRREAVGLRQEGGGLGLVPERRQAPAVDRVLSPSLVRSVAREISVHLGGGRRHGKEGEVRARGLEVAVDEVRGLAAPAPDLGLFLGHKPNRVDGRVRGEDGASVPSRVQGDGGAGEGRDREPGLDEGRMVGHYWLRKSELAPARFLKAQIESTLDAVCNFAADVVSGEYYYEGVICDSSPNLSY
ncbi:uncharacterized protein LOC120286058 [Eucalyptus grandis]|uniref:uncharacterized protein LOC120286058 n=1 Tax=Eucalyptus grandis TaxID=71139 RepID=UPI00192F1121|nr:uncharacterized protein LOC120286058 [Eucalyptus grandis]